MKKLYELEMTRDNVTPRAFYGMVRRALLKKGGVELESWIGDEGFGYWEKPCGEVDAHSTENETICRKPFDFQIAYKDAYNVILEFQFDDDKRGTGYAYIWERDYDYTQEQQPAPEADTPDTPQEAANDEPKANTENEQEEKTMTLLDVHTMNLSLTEDEEIFSVKVLWNDGDSWVEYADTAEAMNDFGADKAVAAWEIDNGTLNVWLAKPTQEAPEAGEPDALYAMRPQDGFSQPDSVEPEAAGQPAPQAETAAEAGTDMTLKLTPGQAKVLLDALCAYDRETRTSIKRCAAPDALPTKQLLLDSYERDRAIGAELRALLYKMATA